MISLYSNENSPSLEQLYEQGLQLNQQLNDPFSKINGFDPVINRYPALAQPVNTARINGFTDDEISDFLLEVEGHANFHAHPDEVNKFFGRTQQTMDDDAAYIYTKQFGALRERFPKADDEHIYNAIELSRIEGVSPVALLSSDKLYTAFLRGQQERESPLDSAIRGGKNYLTGNDNGSYGVQFITGQINRQELEKKVAENSKNFIQEPKILTPGNRLAAGVAGIATQGWKNSSKGLAWAGAALSLAGAQVPTPAGVILPVAAGFYAANAWELFEDQAGNDVYELLQLKDENGQPLDENVAKITACITGAVTVATELVGLKYALNVIPGGETLKNFLGIDRQHVIDAVQNNPFVRDTFARIAIDMSKGISISTLNNVIEAINSDAKIPLAQFISQQPFPQFDWQKWRADTWQHVKDTTVSSLRDFTGSALLSFLFDPRTTNIWRVSSQLYQHKQNVAAISEVTGLPQADVERIMAETLQAKQLEEFERNNNPQPDTAQETPLEATQPQQPQFVYIPADAFRNLIKEHPEIESAKAFSAGEEVAITPETYAQLQADENISPLLQSFADDVRIGAQGVTPHEATQKLIDTDQDKAEIFHSEQNEKIKKAIVQQGIDAGLTPEQADNVGELARVLNAVSEATDGVPMIPVSIVPPEQDTSFSRINPEYDINNPDTWPNQERALQFKSASNWEQLDDSMRNVKNLLDIISGNNTDLGEQLQAQSEELFKGLKGETPEHVKSTIRDLVRQELLDYRTELQASGIDVMDSLSILQLDPERYSTNSDLPRGKKRNPDFSYSFEKSGSKAKIDFAVDGTNLAARIKVAGRKEPLTLSVKNFRTATLPQVIADLTNGNTLAGIPLADTPLAQNIADAFSNVWDELGLDIVPAFRENIADIPAPDTQHDDLSIHALDVTHEDTSLHVDTVKGDVPLEILTSPTDTSKMPLLARAKLFRDESNWHKTVDATLADTSITTRSQKQIPVMQTPLVLTLVGAKHLPVTMNDGKLAKILRDHLSMTTDMLKDIPRAITDPVAIFASKSGKANETVILTEMKDANGAYTLAAFHLDMKGDINRLASAYPKITDGGKLRHQWFRDQIAQTIANGQPLYINTQKAPLWEQDTGIQLLQQGENYTHNEQDLIRLWNQHQNEGYYDIDPETLEPLASYSSRGSRGVIRYVKQAMNNALGKAKQYWATIHELGHNIFDSIQMKARTGSVQSLQDRNTLIQHAGFTVEQFEADKNPTGGVREKVHEYTADAWQTYVWEGKAPTKALQAVFDRARDFILDTYGEVSSQLRVVNIPDPVRAVFDRLLTMPKLGESSVVSEALYDMRLSKQIAAYEDLRKQAEREYAEQMQAKQEVSDNPETLSINPEAAVLVDDYINQLDYRELQRDDLKTLQDYFREVYSAIKQAGGVTRGDVIHQLGINMLPDFYKKHRRIYHAGDNLTYDTVVQQLADMGYFIEGASQAMEGSGSYNTGNVQAFWNFLEQYDPSLLNETIPDIPANIPVNTDTINAFLAAEGVEGTVDYLHKRLKLINSQEQSDTLTAEKDTINDWLRRLDKNFDTDIQPPKHQKPKISKSDLRKGIITGYRLGQQEQADFDSMHEQHSLDTLKARLEKRAQAQADTLRQKREADKSRHQERLQTILQREKDKRDSAVAKTQQRLQRKISMYTQRINSLKNFLAQSSEKRNIKGMIKSIFRMSKSHSISWEKLQEINQLLQGYNLSRSGIKHRDLIRQFLDFSDNEGEQYTQDQAQEFAQDNAITPQMVDEFLSQTHIEDMSLQQVQDLFQHVRELFRQGREQFIAWCNQRDNRRENMRSQLEQDLKAFKNPEPRVIKSKDDLYPRFTSLLGDIAKSYSNAVKTPGRFLRGLGESFRRIFEDGFSQRRGEAFRWIHQREAGFEAVLEQNGLSAHKLFNNAITIDGHNYTWQEAMSIYLGMQNPKHAQAILYGNFIKNLADMDKPYSSETEAMQAISKIIQTVINSPQHKAVADWIAQDFETHFDRINQANIANFNRGMNHEESYSPMIRLQHMTNQGGIDANLEALAAGGNFQQVLQKVNDNFLQQRQNINPENQQPVDLNLVPVWFNAMYTQEFNAALGGYASDVISSLLIRGDNGSVQENIKKRLGVQDWNTLRSIFNDSITDNMRDELDATNKIASWLVRARSFAYVPFRPSVIAAQFASYLTAIPYTNRKHLMRSLATAITDRRAFLERVYEKSPELRYTGGDTINRQITNGIKSSSGVPELLSKAADVGYAGVRLVDKWTKCIVFDAVYNSEIDNGKSEQEAINLANRAVADTQPASNNAQQARFLRGGSVNRLFFSQFMGALMPLFNMTFVDTAYNLTHGGWNAVKDTALRLTAVLASLGFAGLIKDAFAGRLPTGNEQPDGSVDDWLSWGADTTADNLINIIPIFNRFIDIMLIGKKYRVSDRFTEPVEHIAIGFRNLDNENKSSSWDFLQGAALLGIPIPYSGIKEWLRILGLFSNDQ